jgi:hypothetical protein
MRLLISPIDVEEAVIAASAGADIIDVKNPREGSLGANFPWVIKQIREALPPRIEVSATLGDLDFKPGTAALAAFGLSSLGVDYIKAGLYGMKSREQVIEISEKIARSIESKANLVLAAYADYKEINSISPMMLPEIAAKVGAYGVMIDTAQKNGRTLLDHLELEKLEEFVKLSKDLDLMVALAGSLGFREILELKKVKPDIIGVRGLVCDGDRVRGRISEEKVRQLVSIL